MSNHSSSTSVASFSEAFRQATATVFSQVLGAPWNVALSQESPGDGNADDWLTFQLSCIGNLNGNAVICVRKQDASMFTRELPAGETNPPAHVSNDYERGVEEFFRQVSTTLQTAISGEFGEVKLELLPINTPASEGTVFHLLATEGANQINFLLRIYDELGNTLSTAKPLANAELQQTNETRASLNLALLLGIDLDLTLRFGRSNLTLDEILALSPGAVIEVDRQIQEPVDLLLGERLVATGEVVVIDDNYGLRINTVEI
jgi:flagellar motor switch protein FliN/FliY